MSNAIVVEVVAGAIVGASAAALVLTLGSSLAQRLLPRHDVTMLQSYAAPLQSGSEAACIAPGAAGAVDCAAWTKIAATDAPAPHD